MMKSVTTSVKIPIAYDGMDSRERQRLRQICGRDTRIISATIGVIQQHERELLLEKRKKRINVSLLHELVLTATRGSANRVAVEHDLKRRFPRASTNELQECIRTAVSIYNSYLALREKKGYVTSPPRLHGRVTRWMNMPRRARLSRSDGRWTLEIVNSFDPLVSKRRFSRLQVPLRIAAYHRRQLSRGSLQTAQMFRDRRGKWWVTIAVRITPTGGEGGVVETPHSLETEAESESEPAEPQRPPAVVGIDLGIKKAACATVLTPRKVSETRYFVQREKQDLIEKYDRMVASLQHEMATRRNSGRDYSKVARRLREIRERRRNIAREYDRILVKQLVEYIMELDQRYTVYVALGRLQGIRNRARRGNYRGRWYRGMIHRWAFDRITQHLSFKLAQRGFEVSGRNARFRVVPESWTSIMCWRCESRGQRPSQAHFVCPTCGLHTNADRNGSINIAARLITLTSSLREVRGLGKWRSAVERARKRPRLKTHRGKAPASSRGRSSRSRNRHASGGGASATATVQLTLDDGDPVVVRSAETPAVAGRDAPGSTTEERSPVPRMRDEAPANSPSGEGGDARRGLVERTGPTQASSPLRGPFSFGRTGRSRLSRVRLDGMTADDQSIDHRERPKLSRGTGRARLSRGRPDGAVIDDPKGHLPPHPFGENTENS